MASINRRDFFAALGVGGVGAGAGFVYGEAVKRPLEVLVPQVVPPEDFSPGIATWFNSVCRQCPAGCGIWVRVREGRAKKIEGNPAHPVNRGRLCALGQSGLNALYNPDRIRQPLKRTGERGSGEFEAVSWDEALTSIGLRLGTLKIDHKGDRVRLLSGLERGHLHALFEQFMSLLGSDNYHQYDFTDERNVREAARLAFGTGALPYNDIANADLVVSFGADYLGTWQSPVHFSLAYGELRQGDRPRGHCVQIEPRMSLSGANADAWLPIVPGAERLFALALAHALVAGGHYNADDANDWRSLLAGYEPDRVAEATGIAADRIEALAGQIATADAPLVMAGGPAVAGRDGLATAAAVNALNYLAGSVGRAGGLVPREPSGLVPDYGGRLASYADMTDLATAMNAGDVEVLLVHNADPVFGLPDGAQFGSAMAGVDMVVALSSFMDDTTAMADLILPIDTYLEGWSDDLPDPAVTDATVVSIGQPVVARVFDTRAAGDIVLSLARQIGGELPVELPFTDMRDYLRQAWQRLYERSAPADGPVFDTFWNDAVEAGVIAWPNGDAATLPQVNGTAVLEAVRASLPADAAPADAGEFEYALQPYITVTFRDGRGANLPWQQELPDPLTSVVYSSWIELNPATAADLGIVEGDIVELTSAAGSLRAPAFLYHGIRPDVVAMPIGQGHAHYGRYAAGRGVNPIDLLAPATDSKTGALAWGVIPVRLAKTGERRALIQTDGITRTLGRQILHDESDHA